MQVHLLHRPCTGDHEHVRIQGRFTKPSATYVPLLGEALAVFFFQTIWLQSRRLDRGWRSLQLVWRISFQMSCRWLWSAITMTLGFGGGAPISTFWRLVRSCVWWGGLLKKEVTGGSSTLLILMLQGVLWLVADHQLLPFSSLFGSFVLFAWPLEFILQVASLRLVGILPIIPLVTQRFLPLSQVSVWTWLIPWLLLLLLPYQIWSAGLQTGFVYPCFLPQAFWTWPLIRLPTDLSLISSSPHQSGVLTLTLLWAFQVRDHGMLFACGFSFFGASKYVQRQRQRAGVELQDGRRVTPHTAFTREALLGKLKEWMLGEGFCFDAVIHASPPDVDLINQLLVTYGRWLFKEGKPFYHYCVTLNGITTVRPQLRRTIQQAWDLAFMWGSFEPSEHHQAMPEQILIAVITVWWLWGWKREAAVFAMCWGALLRVGELLQAYRSDLITPEDVDFTINYILRRPVTELQGTNQESLNRLTFALWFHVVFNGWRKARSSGICRGRLWGLGWRKFSLTYSVQFNLDSFQSRFLWPHFDLEVQRGWLQWRNLLKL